MCWERERIETQSIKTKFHVRTPVDSTVQIVTVDCSFSDVELPRMSMQTNFHGRTPAVCITHYTHIETQPIKTKF